MTYLNHQEAKDKKLKIKKRQYVLLILLMLLLILLYYYNLYKFYSVLF